METPGAWLLYEKDSFHFKPLHLGEIREMKNDLKSFLAEIEDQSYYIGNEKVVAVSDVITAEKRIEAELRKKKGLILYQRNSLAYKLLKEILGE